MGPQALGLSVGRCDEVAWGWPQALGLSVGDHVTVTGVTRTGKGYILAQDGEHGAVCYSTEC
eukprot:gene16417-1580_t